MGLFDFLTGGGQQSDGSLWGRAAANSPEVMKYYLDQLQARKLAEQAGNIFGTQAAPARAGQYAGPQGPTRFGAMDLNVGQPRQEQPTPLVAPREAQQATGLFAGANPTESKLLQAQKALMQAGVPMGTMQSFDLMKGYQGDTMANMGAMNRLKEKQRFQLANKPAESLYANIRYDPASGRSFGFNKRTGRFEQIPGVAGTPKDMNALDDKEMFSRANVLRDDYRSSSKDFPAIQASWANIANAEDTGIGDVSLIFNIMKMFDPGSTVREGEAATAANASGVPAYVRNLWNSVMRGRALPPEGRKQIVSQARKYYEKQAERQKKLNERYRKRAERFGVNPEDVIEYDVNAQDNEGPAPVAPAATAAPVAPVAPKRLKSGAPRTRRSRAARVVDWKDL